MAAEGTRVLWNLRFDVEENGFLLIDFTPETITLRYLKSNQKSP
jgi:hypothetical protein